VPAGGVFEGRQVPSDAAVRAMQVDEVAGLPVLTSPLADDNVDGYGSAWWIADECLHPDSPGPEYSDPGRECRGSARQTRDRARDFHWGDVRARRGESLTSLCGLPGAGPFRPPSALPSGR
jgi:hypothetical protein